MTAQVPASKASIKQNQYTFRVPGEKKDRSLPFMQYVSADLRYQFGQVTSRIQSAEEAGKEPAAADGEAAARLQYELVERYAPGLHLAVDGEQLDWIVQEWMKASSVTPGESSASADS